MVLPLVPAGSWTILKKVVNNYQIIDDMKKNTSTIIVILAVIALLHFVLIYFFFVRSAQYDQATPNAVPEPTIVPPASGSLQTPERPVVGPAKKKPLFQLKASITRTV
ncbi:MAG: hypothetical protein PHQ27_09135 [Victivallales bacterium]|nr:hypothetical protein [Victivallales bacterium]